MAAEQGTEPRERLASDRVFGVIGGVLLLLGLVFLVRSLLPGGSDTGAGPARSSIPTLAILSPAPGATVVQPMVLELDAGTELALGPTGWTAGGRHLHLFAGGTEVMATVTELQPAGGTRYRWKLHRLHGDTATLRLAWSDERHRTIPDGASAPVPVRLR
ncbi:MAG TPA: hypothetical protein VFT45_20790 [Longimicrobium sp.]|nr:hypothetical protein [Longimicrobium sp.]